MESGYRVQLEVYEGPLELLYQLVEKEQIDIWDIPIARVTEQYLAYLDTLEQLNIDIAAEFIVMAARLLYIKAKMLLPRPPSSPGEDEEEDPRLDLAMSLFEYKLFKEVAQELARMAEGRWGLYPRPDVFRPQNAKVIYKDPAGGMSVIDLARAFQKVLDGYQREKSVPVPRIKVDVGARMLELRRILVQRRRIRFQRLFPRSAARAEVIATFLAVLELMRQGVVTARQEKPFGTIIVELKEAQDLSPDRGGSDDEL